jgi:hypothetical protein
MEVKLLVEVHLHSSNGKKLHLACADGTRLEHLLFLFTALSWFPTTIDTTTFAGGGNALFLLLSRRACAQYSTKRNQRE